MSRPMPSSPDGRAILRLRAVSRAPARVDPLVPLLCALATVVYVLHGFHGYLTRDLGLYSYGAQQFAHGVAPYVGVVNRAGPLAQLIPGIGAFLAHQVGVDDVVGMRVFLMLFAIAGIAATYLLGRDLFRSRVAGTATALAMLSFQGVVTYASDGPREKTSMLLFLLCAMLAVVHRRWFTAGVFTALATLCWQPVLLVAVAGAVTAMLMALPTGRVRAFGRFVLGGLVPSAVFLVWYAAIGELDTFFDDFVVINARYTQQVSLITSPGHAWSILVNGYGPSLAVILIGLVAILVLAVRALRRRDDDTRLRVDLLATGALLVVGVAWSLRAFNGFPDAFIMLPPAALGIGGIAVVVARRLSGRAIVGVLVSWALVCTALGVSYAVSTRNDNLTAQRRAVDAVLDLLPADARILSVEAPQPLVLSGRRNLSRFQLFGNGLVDYVDHVWPGGADGYGRWVDRRRPTLIALGNSGVVPDWLAPALDHSYRRVGTTIGWEWWVRRDVGSSTYDALRAAVKRTYVSPVL